MRSFIESLAHGGGVQLLIVVALFFVLVPVTILALHGNQDAQMSLAGAVGALVGALVRGPGSTPPNPPPPTAGAA